MREKHRSLAFPPDARSLLRRAFETESPSAGFHPFRRAAATLELRNDPRSCISVIRYDPTGRRFAPGQTYRRWLRAKKLPLDNRYPPRELRHPGNAGSGAGMPGASRNALPAMARNKRNGGADSPRLRRCSYDPVRAGIRESPPTPSRGIIRSCSRYTSSISSHPITARHARRRHPHSHAGARSSTATLMR